MKKSLIALAALAATASFAQSTVTIFGVADAAYTSAKTGDSKVSAVTSGNQATSRLGLKGEEDLGSGLKAGFWLEAQVNLDSGVGSASNTNNQAYGSGIADNTLAKGGAVTTNTTNGTQGLTFNRRSTVSMMGGFGEVRVGRDYSPTFWNQTVYDPFGTVGVGASQANAGANPASNYTGVRASNGVAYFTPSMSGFQLQLQTYMGENPSDVADKKIGSGTALRGTYDNGPVSVAVAYSETNNAATTKWKATNFGGSYNLGVAKLMAVYSKDQNGTAADIKGYLVGATAPLGAGTVKFAYSESKQNDVKADKAAIGYVYPFSKRTSLYGTYASVKNSGGSKVAIGGTTGVANTTSTGFDLGVTHSF